MKTLWNLISIIAVVNLLAVLSTAGWLVASGRLDRERWLEVRELLAQRDGAPPAAEADAPAEEESGDVVATTARIDARQRLAQQTSMSLRRLLDEKDQLDRVLEERRQQLEASKAAFEAERKQWDEATAQLRSARTDEQFKKTVKLLESVPPKQAKEMILALVAESKTDQAVGYIDAMSPYKASGVLKAFKGEDENKVATDLLERLRQRANGARSAGSASTPPPNGTNPPDSSGPSSGPADKPLANQGAAVGAGGGGSQPGKS